MNIAGIIPALITPFEENGHVALGALSALVDFLIEDGVDGFYACGSTAECFLLSMEERKQVLEAIMRTVDGRVPVIAHVGRIASWEAAELAEHAVGCGVAAVSSVPPFYYNFSLEEIAGYYETISQAVPDMPLILYNIPAFSGVSLTAENLSTILDVCNGKGLKYTAYNLFELDRIRRAFPKLSIYNGHDELYCNALPLGITGAIGSTFNVMAPKYQSIRRCYKSGDMERAGREQQQVNELIDVMIQCGVFQSVKYLLSKKGIPCGKARSPFGALSEEKCARLDGIYEEVFRKV